MLKGKEITDKQKVTELNTNIPATRKDIRRFKKFCKQSKKT